MSTKRPDDGVPLFVRAEVRGTYVRKFIVLAPRSLLESGDPEAVGRFVQTAITDNHTRSPVQVIDGGAVLGVQTDSIDESMAVGIMPGPEAQEILQAAGIDPEKTTNLTPSSWTNGERDGPNSSDGDKEEEDKAAQEFLAKLRRHMAAGGPVGSA